MRFRIQAVLSVLLMTSVCSAETLWEDDFNVDSSDLYDLFIYTEDRDNILFDFDYSALGIPEAPHSTSGGTTGVKMTVNDTFEDTVARASAVQIAPIGLDNELADKDFTMIYDVWMNVNGPLPGGGGGSTEALMAGVGFSAQVAIEVGNSDGTYFTLVGEAGVTTDIRSFTDDGFNGTNLDSNTPINVAGDSMNDNAYFAEIFPGGIDVGTLPVQGGQDNQTGVTIQGQMAFAWHQVQIDVRGNEVSFLVDGLLIARDEDAVVDGNIMVGYSDYFSSVTDVPEWGFGLIDNLRVFTPVDGDFNGNGEIDTPDIDLLTTEVIAGTNLGKFDLNGDGNVDQTDRTIWVNELAFTYFGDSNLDGEFNSSDFVKVFQAQEYEDAIVGNSTWGTGDWNGDGDFDSADFVKAFQEKGYEIGPRQVANAVPEPGAIAISLMGIGWLCASHRRRR